MNDQRRIIAWRRLVALGPLATMEALDSMTELTPSERCELMGELPDDICKAMWGRIELEMHLTEAALIEEGLLPPR